MCGIVGLAGRFSSDLLAQMMVLIRHRGPDDFGSITAEHQNITTQLGQQRLSIIDLSANGHQPMTVRCGCCQAEADPHQKLWLVFNGEIYNHLTLRNDLIAKGHTFTSHTDSEVLIHLYAEYGVAMLSQLRGIYSFAIYDGRASGQKEGVQRGDLWIVRDELGVKPLYYAQTREGFLFASELKALLACTSISRELDLDALDQYLSYLWCTAPRTPLKQVKKLEPGHALLVRGGQVIRHWRYYEIPYGQSPLLTGTFNEISAELAERVKASVSRQLIADVPIGAFLSGGLDSSAIVAFMRQLQPERPVECFTIETPGQWEGFVSDLPYAQLVAKHLGVPLHIVQADSQMLNQLGRILYHMDEPQADPAPLNALLISELAQQQGLKVLMSGAGGDDIFSGYRRHQVLHLQRYWHWLPMGVKKSLASWARTSVPTHGYREKYSVLRRAVKLLACCDATGNDLIARLFEWNTSALRSSLYRPEIQRQLSGQNPLLSALGNMPDGVDELNKMLYLDSKFFLTDHNLNYTDKVSMAVGIEVRVPLLDLDLVEFATRIPSNMKQQGMTGKAIFKKAMEPYLPREIIYRPKTGFGAPVRQWLRGPWKPLVLELLSESSLRNRGLYDFNAVQQLIRLDEQGKVDGTYTLLSLLCIELWCRQFVDATVPTIINL